MAAASMSNPDDPLLQAYHHFDIALRLRQTKMCTALAMILVPSCVGLDFFVYREMLWPFFKSRLLTDLAMLPCFFALFTPLGRRYIKLFDAAPLIFSAIAISWMIYTTEGVPSPYYAGLNIVMAAAILLVPYTLIEASLICAFVMASYAIACLLHQYWPPHASIHAFGETSSRTLFNNLYFLTMTAVIAVTACRYSSLRRFEEFRLRHELDENNQQLSTTLKKLQDTEVQLVQSEKMNALGKLSAGLLHEINNPLNFTFMALQIAQGEAGENAELKETLTDIGQGMSRIKSVIADLRAFAYPTDPANAETFSLDETLTTALRLTAHELGNITVERENLTCDAVGAKTQIVHVFMNLLVNSAHAMKKTALNRPLKIIVSAEKRGERVFVKVRDNGVGVKPENLPKLFEPFFTTKQPGEGTGLGLSICHTIVSNHGGLIGVESEFGQWTQMTFDLPLTTREMISPSKRDGRSPNAPANQDARESASSERSSAIERNGAEPRGVELNSAAASNGAITPRNKLTPQSFAQDMTFAIDVQDPSRSSDLLDSDESHGNKALIASNAP